MNKSLFALLAIISISIQQLGAQGGGRLGGGKYGFEFEELETGDAIMELVEQRFAAVSEIEVIKMAITDSSGVTSERRFLSIIQRDPAGNYSYLIRFLDPPDIQGVTLVTRDQGAGESEQYLYLPALGQIRSIKGAGKANSFMGTDFSFEDLRKENSTEYTFTRQFDDDYRNKECYVILSAPADYQKREAKGFSSRVIYIEKGTYKILKIEYYNDEQELLKTFEAENYDSINVDGPSERPHRAVMKNHSTNSISVMTLERSRLNYDVDPNIFTVQAIQAWTPEYTRAYLNVFNQHQEQPPRPRRTGKRQSRE